MPPITAPVPVVRAALIARGKFRLSKFAHSGAVRSFFPVVYGLSSVGLIWVEWSNRSILSFRALSELSAMLSAWDADAVTVAGASCDTYAYVA